MYTVEIDRNSPSLRFKNSLNQGGLFLTSIFHNTTMFKNSKGVPLLFSPLILQLPKIQGKYSNFRGGAVPDKDCEKYQMLGLIREGLFRGGGCSGRSLLYIFNGSIFKAQPKYSYICC